MKTIQFGFDENEKYEKTVNKARAVVLDKQGRALVVKYAGLYMLPGGKIDEGETELQALKREISEEAGIEINEKEAEKFLTITSYNKNYYDRVEKRNINRISNTVFYIVHTDKDIDNSKKNLTESEKEEGQTIEFMNISKIRYFVETNKDENKKRESFDREILTALSEFQNFQEKDKQIDERK